jgi:leader peptidase (prepilin peptidase) / N-methyltransferase
MPLSFSLPAAAVLGAVLGSFLNVVAYRLPRHESLVAPGSRCTSCGSPVRPFDNVPIISWLVLRGHCRRCSAGISARYPLVELATALLVAGVVLAQGTTANVALGAALVLLLVPCALIDLEHRIIPNRLTAVGAVLAIVIGTALDPGGEPARLIAGVAAGGFLLIAALAYPRGMGMGDVKLVGVMGLFLGPPVAAAILIGLLVGVTVGVVIMARKGVAAGRKTKVPFGPFLALGGVTAIFIGSDIVHFYVHHFVH